MYKKVIYSKKDTSKVWCFFALDNRTMECIRQVILFKIGKPICIFSTILFGETDFGFLKAFLAVLLM